MEKVLVAGANGTTGKKIVELLKSSQYFTPVAMVRKESQKVQFEAHNVQTVLADLEDQVDHAVKGIDKIIFAAGSGGKNVKEVDENGAKKLIDAGKKEQVKKFVMLSSMGADHPEDADKLQDYLFAKQHADEYLMNSNIPYTIVRPGSLTNEAGVGKISLANKFKEHGNITREDVAHTLVHALHDNAALNQTFEILEGNTLIGKAIPSS